MQSFLRKALLSCFLCGMTVFLTAQETITGVITDDDKEPIIGATILILGTTKGTVTDIDGRFSIQHTLPFTLEVRYLGFEIKNIEVSNTDELDISLAPELSDIFEACFPIIVSGERSQLPQILNFGLPINRLNKQEIRQTGEGFNLTEALDALPGLQVQKGALNTQRLSIRGIGARTPFSTDGPSIYYGDIPLVNGSGESTLEDLEPSLIEALNIVRGTSPVAIGANLGGAIYLEPSYRIGGLYNQPPLEVFSSFSMGDFRRRRFRVGTRYQKQGENHTWFNQLNYTLSTSDGYRENNLYRREHLSWQGNYGNNKTSLSYIFQYQLLDAEIPSSLNINDFEENPRQAAANWAAVNGFEDNLNLFAGIGFGQQLLDKGSWRLRLRSSIWYNNLDNNEVRPFNVLEETGINSGARFGFEIDFDETSFVRQILVGVEYGREDYEQATFQTLEGGAKGDPIGQGEEDHNRQFSYLQLAGGDYKLQWSAGVNLRSAKFQEQFPNLGIDISRQLNNEWLPQASLRYSWADDQFLNARIARGYRLINASQALETAFINGQNLEAEIGWQTELGLKGYLSNGSLQHEYEVNLYQQTVDNALINQQGELGQVFLVNAGQVQYRGLEIALKQKKSARRELLSFTNNIYYTLSLHRFKDFEDAANGDFSGNDLTGVPRHRLQAWTQFDFNGFAARLSFDHTSQMPVDDANTVFSEAYSLFHFRLSYSKTWKLKNRPLQMDIWMGLNNIFDQRYASMVQVNARGFGSNLPRYFYPGLPRYLFGGISMSYRFLEK